MSEAPYDEAIKMIQVSSQPGVGQSIAMTTPVTLTTGGWRCLLVAHQKLAPACVSAPRCVFECVRVWG